MTSEKHNDDRPTQKFGQTFDFHEEHESSPVSRQAKTFTPSQDETLTEAPESITTGERLPHISEYSSIRLEVLPLKGLKSFLYGIAALIVILGAWEIFNVFKNALDIHWLAGGAFLVFVTIVTGLGLRLLWRYLSDKENLEALEQIQEHSSRLSDNHDFGNAKPFINKLQLFYVDKPQAVFLQRCLKQLADYSNDREVIAHVERTFLQPLDQEAIQRVSSYSLQTGVSVAISPWASLDILLAFWRNMAMIDAVAQVYGIRPSLANRLGLLKSVLHQLAFVGASEVIIDQLANEMGASSLAGIASARLGQGLGASVYTAKIGIAAMSASRPIGFSKEQSPELKAIVVPIMKKIRQKLMPV